MADDYAKVFGLLDNPFGPLEPIVAGIANKYQADLASKPLRLNRAPGLEKLYCPTAGPFLTYLANFQRFAREKNFKDDPPKVGVSSLIFSIYGFEGTGKTTLAQRIVTWLKLCTPKNDRWQVFDEIFDPPTADPAQQIVYLDALQTKLNPLKEDAAAYLCIVVDDIASQAVLDRALALFDRLSANWVVFLFLLSNRRELFSPLSSGNSKRNISPFKMWPLGVDWALAFVEHRIRAYRDPAFNPPWLQQFPLYPFSKDDVEYAFRTPAAAMAAGSDEDTVSLRQFGTLLERVLARRMTATADDFEARSLDAAQAEKSLLILSKEYRELADSAKLAANG